MKRQNKSEPRESACNIPDAIFDHTTIEKNKKNSLFKRTRFIFIFFLNAGLLIPLIHMGQNSVESYISKYKGLAVHIMQEYGIPVSVVLGIAIIESGSGRSKNCKNLNNHFGMMSSKGRKLTPAGYYSYYRYYESDTLSYQHFATYISKRKFYPNLKNDTSYLKWLTAIRKAGYSTSQHRWEHVVVTIIRQYKLWELDQ